MNTTNWKIF